MSTPVPAWSLQGWERTSELLPGQLLLVRAQLEVLGGQLQTQRVGTQRVHHVLVALPTVLHEERTPVGLGGADQLQALQRHEHGYKHSRNGCPAVLSTGLLPTTGVYKGKDGS